MHGQHSPLGKLLSYGVGEEVNIAGDLQRLDTDGERLQVIAVEDKISGNLEISK